MTSEYCLVTGASGFLGGYVARACRTAGWATHGVDLAESPRSGGWERFHLGRTEDLDWDAVLATPPRYCFHLAGGASVPASVANPIEDFESLLPGTARMVLAMARRAPECVLILFSSAAVYGAPTTLPVREDYPLQPVSPYGIHKALAEELVAHYARLFGLKTVALRTFSAYGEGLRKQLFWDLCRKAVAAGRGGTVELSGSGHETRDFIHAEDVARAALAAAQAATSTPGCERINVASGTEISIAEAARIMLDALQLPHAMKFDGQTRRGDPPRWVADITRLQQKGFVQKRDLRDGLAAYARWFLSLPQEHRA